MSDIKDNSILPDYFKPLEERILLLENELSDLKQKQGTGLKIQSIPETNLFSEKFLDRAFTIWGHYFVANLIIGVPLAFLLLLIGGY